MNQSISGASIRPATLFEQEVRDLVFRGSVPQVQLVEDPNRQLVDGTFAVVVMQVGDRLFLRAGDSHCDAGTVIEEVFEDMGLRIDREVVAMPYLTVDGRMGRLSYTAGLDTGMPLREVAELIMGEYPFLSLEIKEGYGTSSEIVE